MRIAYEHADSLKTYPQASNLSASVESIRKRRIYPRVCDVRMRFSIPRAAHLSTRGLAIQVLSSRSRIGKAHADSL